MSWQIAALGLVVGVLVGLSGVGAGVLAAPALILLGVPPAVAVGTDLAHGGLTKLVGSLRNASARLIDGRWVLWTSAGGIPGAAAGTLLGAAHPGGHLIRAALGAVLIAAAGAVAARDVLARSRALPAVDLVRRTPLAVAALGLGIGLLVGLTSVGSGSLFMIVLLAGSRLPPARAVATDIAVAVGISLAGAVLHLAAGTVDLHLAANLLVGSVPGILLGARWSTRVPARPLRFGIAALLLLAGIHTL